MGALPQNPEAQAAILAEAVRMAVSILTDHPKVAKRWAKLAKLAERVEAITTTDPQPSNVVRLIDGRAGLSGPVLTEAQRQRRAAAELIARAVLDAQSGIACRPQEQ